MRPTLLCAAGILTTGLAFAQHSVVDMTKARPLGVAPAATPAQPGLFLGGGGTCATPTVIPAGPSTVNFPFDNSVPASGGVSTNPFELLCSHSQQMGIANEEWWSWTASVSGLARLSTCSNLTGVDTKIAIYADDCPNMGTLDPLACKDDSPDCPGFETKMVWDITAGTTYLIQLGTFFNAPGGVGDFSIEELPPLPSGQYDTGVTQNAYGPGAAPGDVLWLQVFDAGAGATLTAVDAAFGTPGGAVPPDGSPATIGVWAGDPLGTMTLLHTESILSANSATDTAVNYPLSTPVAVSGLYTVGVRMTAAAGTFPAPADATVNSYARAFFCWDNAATIDLNDPTTAQVPPTEMQFGFAGAHDCVWMLRVHDATVVPAYADVCNGDGGDQLGCSDCPCGNNAPMGTIGGCLNSSGGATRLLATGSASVTLPSGSTSDLRFAMSGGPAFATSVLLSGDAVAPQNLANPCFGLDSGSAAADRDGLRCAVQSVQRHGNRQTNALGDIADPSGPNRVWGGEAQPTDGIAVASGFASGQTRFFQVTHRESPTAVCMRGLNTSQAVEVVFVP